MPSAPGRPGPYEGAAMAVPVDLAATLDKQAEALPFAAHES